MATVVFPVPGGAHEGHVQGGAIGGKPQLPAEPIHRKVGGDLPDALLHRLKAHQLPVQGFQDHFDLGVLHHRQVLALGFLHNPPWFGQGAPGQAGTP